MVKLTQVTTPADFKAKAIITFDPAASNDCGIALRFTTALMQPQRGKLPAPDWTYGGSVWNTAMHDELGIVLAKGTKKNGGLVRGDKVAFVIDPTAYGVIIAKSLGQSIGAIRALLNYLNVLDEKQKPLEVYGVTWRKSELPAIFAEAKLLSKPAARARWKSAANEAMAALYNIDTENDNLSEAVLLNDHVVLHKPEFWR